MAHNRAGVMPYHVMVHRAEPYIAIVRGKLHTSMSQSWQAGRYNIILFSRRYH